MCISFGYYTSWICIKKMYYEYTFDNLIEGMTENRILYSFKLTVYLYRFFFLFIKFVVNLDIC